MAKKLLKELDYHKPEDHPRLKEEALKFTNKIRTALGLPTIAELMPGAIEQPGRCTLNRSIVAEGLFPFVDYDHVQIIKPEYVSQFDSDQSGEGPTKDQILKQFKVPDAVKVFLGGFDMGYFPELVTD